VRRLAEAEPLRHGQPALPEGGHRSYSGALRSVGIKALKNQLSRHIDLARQGEIVLVTDRDEVVAEIRAPSQPFVTRASPWIAFLEEQARRGSLQLAKRKHSRLQVPKHPLGRADVQKMLRDDPDDRS